ncbi:uncharacterized protein LOC116431483 [Nomia melanderi]|uniref:uncharacterized protein LOC116431483 n=1 Tax=Nomia melanderi TaxID=2448451 RepID=UPI003FCC9E0C
MIQLRGDNEEHEKVKEKKEDELAERRRLLMEKSAVKRRTRQTHIERRDATEAERLQRAKEAFDLKLRRAERDERLAKELARRKNQEHQESFQRRKARHSFSIVPDSVVRDLEAKLTKEKQQDGLCSESKWPFSDEDPERLQEKKLSYRRELQNQLINNRRRQREKEEEKHRERKILEEVGETLREEELEAEKLKRDKALLLQAERDAFLKARQIWKDKRREVLKREHDEIARIINQKETRQKEEVQQKTDIQSGKDAMAEEVGKQIQEAESRKMERERICRELYLAEKENELANEVMRLALKKKRTARDLLEDMARHQKAAAERKAKDDAIDAAFARYLAEEHRKMEAEATEKEQRRREAGSVMMRRVWRNNVSKIFVSQ